MIATRLRFVLLFVVLLSASASAQWPHVPRSSSPPVFDSALLDRSETVTRLAFGSCYKASLGGDGIWHAIGEVNPNLFVFAGDTLYPQEDDESAGLANLRSAYRALGDVSAFAALRAKTPVVAIWDDHDYGRNDGGGDFPWRFESEKLFESAWTQDGDVRRQRPGVYFSESLGSPGKQLQLIVLDTRFFRSPLRPSTDRGAKGKERYLPALEADKTMLGADQWLWLETQLEEDADLRIIVSSIQLIADGHGWEGWRQLPHERDRLFSLLRANDTAPVVVLSGDRHVAGFYEQDIGTTAPLVEFTSSALNNPISFPNRNNTLAEDGPYRLGELYGDASFGSVDIDWKAGVVELRLHDETGEVVRSLLRSLSN